MVVTGEQIAGTNQAHAFSRLYCGSRRQTSLRLSISATIPPMRSAWLLLLTAILAAQSRPRAQTSHTSETLRGVSAVSRQIAWASGTHGTYLRTTNAGRTWIPAQVPGAVTLDFRAVVAFFADEAFLMSAGPGELSRIYHTTDAGRNWQLQFTNTNPKGFFDSMVFWDRTHGIVLGDPIPDESGQLKFELLLTDDGHTWHPIPPSQLPPAFDGEGAFAASNTCLAILSTKSKSGPSGPRAAANDDNALAPADPNIWFATGGKAARVFHSADRGQTWQVFDTPIFHGPDSAGIFTIAFLDPLHGLIAGGDYQHPNQDVPNLATTDDGGKTFRLFQTLDLRGYISAIALDPRHPARVFYIGPDYIVDSDRNHRIKYPRQKFYAASRFPDGGALFVGPNGAIGSIP